MKLLERINKIKDNLYETNSFRIQETFEYIQETNTVRVFAYQNYLIIKPLNHETEAELKNKKYVRLLHSKKHTFALFYFSKNIQDSETREKNVKLLSTKLYTRYENLLKAREKGNIEIYTSIALPLEEFLQLEYRAEPYNSDDFKDENIDTTCNKLQQEQKPFIEIKKVNTNYNTVLLLENKSLGYFKNSKDFYNNAIINYILEHSKLLNPDNFKYENSTKPVHIKARELKKLFPYRNFNFVAPAGVTIRQITKRRNNQNAKQISQNDTYEFIFSDEFLNSYQKIISKKQDREKLKSFVKIPMFFILEALKQENLGSQGFRFLLFILSLFRISKPKLLHSVRAILTESGIELKHGFKKPIERLNKYFTFLYVNNVFSEVVEVPTVTTKNVDFQIKINGDFLKLKKPKKNKTK